ncbi:undecaprenyldiphospho-muramoylpentapeptide beta-N-acetylglucosaminyltransferase [Paramaledivibacter caminithermalis]|uniref:UDP-N-acetylglucosamine--N-acetylmuramyl-(pentapeptide) pyrophosphoryl-undecaprenol N-acetylglucosamine transferase n=1 Tax=Paramaledivibacter caminithermalis (strain DSM 15212 / CIP 107654 / DViRD3) TaxID=1121301 RepID=A0A1M6NZJ4_PARC5|nr:undecaprenyldiphospho-muramoylpentapeptide beta-N-acetylglucosaminyltransferase [Paramaledivibacter caminithermalis]SHK01116.1 UDP-N-acetylglucosamine-N-acetylmuramylpentapeptide N-acetylglucosamine transferase [Paramaledivibacter caminithermalis DSM 15212]
MKRIVMTGGGTAGHVTPNIALIPRLKKLGYDIHYIGTEKGIERKLIEKEGIPYHIVNAGKLRRYLDIKNLTDTFRITQGFMQSLAIINRLKPSIVFSKGGFVSSPVVWAAWMNRIPIVIHESDYTPGLANKIAIPFAKKICYTFPETENYISKEKGILTGIPVRESLFSGEKRKGTEICNFDDEKPSILIIGGSLGSEVINKSIRANIKAILKEFQVCHICGRGNVDKNYQGIKGYEQFEYVSEELSHLFAMADLIISRAGATVLYEILALRKPNILIPLSKKASRGDQILNAKSFEKQGLSYVIMEEELGKKSILEAIEKVYSNRKNYIHAMNSNKAGNGIDEVIKVIIQCSK